MLSLRIITSHSTLPFFGLFANQKRRGARVLFMRFAEASAAAFDSARMSLPDAIHPPPPPEDVRGALVVALVVAAGVSVSADLRLRRGVVMLFLSFFVFVCGCVSRCCIPLGDK